MHYANQRDCYDPATGRFCQPDPIGVIGLAGLQGLSLPDGAEIEDDAGPAQLALALAYGSSSSRPVARSINLYGFVAGNPLSWVDPLGLAPYEHHWVPQSIFRNANLPAEAFRVFNQGVTAPLSLHQYDMPHRMYNEAARELWDRHLREGKIDPSKMTEQQAEKILRDFKKCPDARMKPLQRQIWNRAIREGFKRLPPRGND